MTLHKLYAQIESHQFAVRTNVVSGFRHFLSALVSDRAVQELLSAAKNEQTAVEVVKQAVRLARQKIDLRYENPFDAATAAYLLVLQSVRPELARIGADAAMLAPNCWWARKVASWILAEPRQDSESEESNPAWAQGLAAGIRDTCSVGTGESFISAGLASQFLLDSQHVSRVIHWKTNSYSPVLASQAHLGPTFRPSGISTATKYQVAA